MKSSLAHRNAIGAAVNGLWRVERINGDDLCPTYMYRFVLAKFPGGRRVYIHFYVGNDWSRDPHDHPKEFWSIGLWGAYQEEVYKPINEVCIDGQVRTNHEKIIHHWHAPWVRRFPANHIHRLRCSNLTITIAITGKVTRDWGFWMDGLWVPFREYLSKYGFDRKDC